MLMLLRHLGRLQEVRQCAEQRCSLDSASCALLSGFWPVQEHAHAAEALGTAAGGEAVYITALQFARRLVQAVPPGDFWPVQ
jgi:hypothetical protein